MREAAQVFEEGCRQALARAGGGELEIRQYPTEVGAISCELWLLPRHGGAWFVGHVPQDLPRREAERVLARVRGRPEPPMGASPSIHHAPAGGYRTTPRFILGDYDAMPAD
jgi:hypothetical protein